MARPLETSIRRRRTTGLDEAFVAWLWESRGVPSAQLRLPDGTALRVVFAGRRWGGAGPDFRGAVLERPDGTLIRGDVEVHLHAADWRIHGHGRDPEYNRVVLHVVLDGSADGVQRADGTIAPTAVLAPQLGAAVHTLQQRFTASRGQAALGAACVHNADQAGDLLDTAGLTRFHARAARLEGDLTCLNAEQVLYRELLAAMGYSANQAACRRLSELVPYDEVATEALARPLERRADVVQALLLGHGGLLPVAELAVPGRMLNAEGVGRAR
jgi:hypothetical protein